GGEALLHVAVEFPARGIDGFLGVDQPGKGAAPPEDVVELLVALDRSGELLAGLGSISERCELALEILLEGRAVGIGAVEVAFHPWIIDPGVKRTQIPFRKLSERRLCGGFGGEIFLCVPGVTLRLWRG